MKLNEKRTEALPFFWTGLGCVLIFVLGVVISNAEIPLLSGLAYLALMASGMAAPVFFLLALWHGLANLVHLGHQSVALHILPEVPPAIAPASNVFDVDGMPRVVKDTPKISSDLFDHFESQALLRDHVAYLNDVHAKVVEFLKPAPVRYADDQARVERQQLALYRMAHQAATVARKVEASFPKLKADLATVPQPKLVKLPALPKLQSLKNLDQQHKNFAMGSGRAIAQGATQGGVAGAAIAAVASIAIGVVAQQKQIRAMEEAHGSLGAFINRAADDIGLLGLAHEELVDTSREVHRQSAELRTLLLWAKEADARGLFKSEAIMTPDDRVKMLSLTTYALIARIEAAKAT